MSSQAAKINASMPLGLIAGSGQFPIDVATRARERNIPIIAVAHVGETNPSLESLVEKVIWVYPGQLGKIIRALKKSGVKQTVLAGGLTRQKLFKGLRPDLTAVILMARLKTL